jgi:polyphenol oxidase
VAIERRELGGRVRALVSTTLERAGFLAAFTERTGGVSPAPFDSLNLSLVTDDDAANGRENRARVLRGLGIPPFATPYQVHGAKVIRVGEKRAGAGFEDPETRIPGADALYTKSRRLPLAVMTADCLPVILADAEGTAVAVVHAGWRGLAAGVLGAAVGAFEDPRRIRAVIGPAIGLDHYEVEEDVALAVASGSESGAVTRRRDGTLFLDLAGTARGVMKGLGVARIEDVALCTACESKRFYSHRRDGVTGRQGAIAMRL